MHAFFVSGIRILIYEMITEISFPISPTVTIAVLHAAANTINLMLSIVSDNFDRNIGPDMKEENIFNDGIQLFFLATVTFIA
jgi:hypothetical protein